MRANGPVQRAKTVLRSAFRLESASELIEVALIMAIISLGAVAAVSSLGCEIRCFYENIAISMAKGRANIPPGQLRKCMKGCP